MFSGISSCVFFVACVLLVAWPLWRIFEKAGYPGIASLLAYIPLVNLVLLWYAALNEWPIERERRALRGATGPAPGADPYARP